MEKDVDSNVNRLDYIAVFLIHDIVHVNSSGADTGQLDSGFHRYVKRNMADFLFDTSPPIALPIQTAGKQFAQKLAEHQDKISNGSV
ncbi:MAG: hypothetical protein ACRECY_08720 [Phyllobacterium sp.]